MGLSMKRFVTALALGFLILFASLPCQAKTAIAVVTNRNSRLTALTTAQVKAIFLSNENILPNGVRITLADQEKTQSIKLEFYEAIAQMDLKDVSRHWAKIIFTGRGMPPEQVDGGDEGVKSWIKSNPNGIGYIHADSVDGSVKVLLKIAP